MFCDEPPPALAADSSGNASGSPAGEEAHRGRLSVPSLRHVLNRSRTPSPEPTLTPLAAPPVPRRMVVLLVGLKPHRKLWTLSARPGESVINYILLNGCPAIVVPVKVGSPLLAWDTLTVEELWKVEFPESDGRRSATGKFEGIVDVIFEYLDLCVDWERVKMPGDNSGGESPDFKNRAVKDAVALLVAAAIRSRDSAEARKELEVDRSGIAMWRIP